VSGNRWLASARAAHTRALGAVQAFPLFGDGEHAAAARGDAKMLLTADPEITGAALAEARYRDWHAQRATGAASAYAPRGAAYAPPPLVLAPDDAPAVVQTRFALPVRQRGARDADRLAAATLIIRGLVAEFGDLFPDECAAAVAWLGAP
jgi:hypothetical protein